MESKIAVVYKNRRPPILSGRSAETCRWRFEYFERSSVLGIPVVPHQEYLAVLFPVEGDDSIQPAQLTNIFPGAEFIGYREGSGSPIERADGLSVVRIPMAAAFADYLLENLELSCNQVNAIVTEKRRAAEMRRFFDAFLDMVESAWTVTERRVAVNLLIEMVLQRIGAEECVIYLSPEGGSRVDRAYCSGNISNFDLFEHQANNDIIQIVLSRGTPYIDNDCNYEFQIPFSTEKVAIRSILCYPLERRGETIGALQVLNKASGEFREEDHEIIRMLINPFAVAMGTIRMFDSSERLTITDDLTKLYNYRYLKQYLSSEVKRCLRYKKKVSLLFIDVDGFKQINDTFGHLVGSSALAEMGSVLQRNLRESDVIGRYGGDEFVAVLPETPLNGALVIAERIRRKVEDYEFVANDLSIRLTVSLGVANCPRHTLTAEGLIKKADAAMYRAKELSKNTIRVAV
jgi:diguanylate cyclase (GGDEF)-like protein